MSPVLGIGAFRRFLYPFFALVSALLVFPRFLAAGSTGTTELHTPQGDLAGTASGDFVSDAGGLSSVYRYFIEVPAGLSRLQIQIFDADIGAGGAGETLAGRDRSRSGFNTSAAYSLFDPGGTNRPTSFTTGNNTLPAGGDNAWLDFYNATGKTVGDNFGTAAYTNNDGNNNWSAAWIENDSAGAGANAGSIQIIGGELRLQDNGATGFPSLEREVDLSSLGMAVAFLTFTYRTSNNLEAGDMISVQVSGNGGGSWTNLETFSNDSSGSRSYNISGFIATNTRIRFVLAGGYDGIEYFYVDNLQIADGPVTAGHWELRVDMAADSDINAIGIRAHDGDSGSGGTELNVYFDSMAQYGANPPAAGTSGQSYTLYPYITSGCSAGENDFDYDSNRGNVGSMSFSSRTGSFTQNLASAALSADNVWTRNTLSGWTSDTDSVDYGIWTASLSITSYLVGSTPNGNYAALYMTNSQAAANPPTANPQANSFRVYLPTDAGAAPVEPYLEQLARWASFGPNPPAVGQTSRYTVTVRVVNPTPRAITFSASNLVTANVPGGGTTYHGLAQVSQGSIVSQPAGGGTGNITWNPGSLAAGATALLAYQVRVLPTSVGQRIPVTATPASGNGTRAQFVDGTGNTTQARATYLFGPLCELAVTQGLLTQAVVSSFRTYAAEDGGVLVEWTTASEAGTAGFYLSRWDTNAKRFVPIHEGLLPGLMHAPQGGTYRFVDDGAAPGAAQTYLLEEVAVTGKRQRFGPFTASPSWDRPESLRSAAETSTFESEPHPALRRAVEDGSEIEDGEFRQVAAAAKGTSADGARLTIRENGLYYLSSNQIASWLNMTVDDAEVTIAKGKLQLTRNGLPVAWYPDSAGAKVKTAQGLFFYGQTVESLYSRDTAYHLRASSSGGVLMQALAVRPIAAAPGGSFPESQASEVDSFPATAISPDPESDYWFWEFLVAGDPTYGHKIFNANAPGLAPGTPGTPGNATLTVNLQGATDTHTAGEHRAAVSLNGTLLGELQWQGITPKQGTFAVPAGLLLPTGNQVEVTATVGGGAPYSILYFDGFQLGYPRFFSAAGDALAFTSGGNARVTVTGLSAPAVRLLDITNPLRPRWMTGAATEADPAGAPGSYRASFAPPSPTARYLAAGPSALKAPAAVRPWNTPDLRSTSLRADVLIVVPAETAGTGFEAPAERLASLRRSQGLEALVVNLDQVADTFGEGIATPQALKSFIRFASQSWTVPPRYVILAGEGSLDYRNLQGYGDCVMPPLMIQGEGGLFPADNRFTDTSGDGLPDLALGRIPVLTSAELNAYVDKILTYEGSGTPGWAANVLMLADNQDGSASFSADSDRISALLPGYAVDRIYLSSMPLSAARTELLQGIQNGASWVNYLGHGGLDRLSAGGLLTNGDVAGLTNGGKLPVVTAMTCTINRFAVPGVASLGEVLVKSPTGGAAAVWGPSGLSYHGEARQLAEVFYRLAPKPGGQRLGDSVLRALAEFGALGGDSRMLDIYNLLGDPSLLVRQGPAPAASGGSSGE